MTALEKKLLSPPQVAFPTLLLALGSMGLLAINLILVAKGTIPLFLSFILSFVVFFAIFTPMHEGAHRSMSRVKPINELVGRISASMLLVAFPFFRFVHLEHHRYTNVPEKDPDFLCGQQPFVKMVIGWLFLDFFYVSFYLKHIKKRPKLEVFESLITVILLWSSIITLCYLGYAQVVLLLWVIPARIAVFMLAFSLDYLPHKPHKITSVENPYQATMVREHWLLTPLMFYQNYHLIHHLYPSVPFYRYAKVWKEQKSMLLSKGVEVRNLFGKNIS